MLHIHRMGPVFSDHRKEAWRNVKTEGTEKKKTAFGGWKTRFRRAACLILTGAMAASSVLPGFAAEQKTVLACAYAGHSHEAQCYDGDGNLICGYADFVVHRHDENCFDEEGNLVCTLPEITEHRHDSSCYESRKVLICKEPESDGHVHSDQCNSLVQGEMICENTEEDHQHTDDCYSWEMKRTCGKEEGEGSHHHGDGCYEIRDVLVCGKKEVILHTHSDDCYTPVLDENGNVVGRKLSCGMLQVERHQHGENCLKTAEQATQSVTAAAKETTQPTTETTAETTQPTTEATEETTEPEGVEAIAALIAALPEAEEIGGTLENLEETPEAYQARLDAITAQVREAYAAYMALTEEQRETVENREKLLTLWEVLGLEAETLEDNEDEIATAAGGFPGYVQALSISKVTDGTANFDETEGDGNDTGEDNRIVRTYDTVRYHLTATMASRDQDSVVREANLCFDMEMEKDITEARFEIDAMTWLKTISDWQIEYFRGGELVLVRKPDGILYMDQDGDGVFTDATSVNALAYGSENGERAYRLRGGDITRQRLVGALPLTNDNNVLAATQSLDAVIRVLNDHNGAVLSPRFRVSFEKNPENYGAYTGEGAQTTSQSVIDNGISLDSYAGGAYQVAITCAPLYNVKLRNASESVSYISWFNFETGDEVKSDALRAFLNAAGALRENYDKVDPSQYTYAGDSDVEAAYLALSQEEQASLSSLRYGRMHAIGITVSIGSHDPEKGYKGCSLPVGELTFDLSLDVTAESTGNADTSGYGAILWDYTPNVTGANMVYKNYEDESSGHTRQARKEANRGWMDRNLYWEKNNASRFGTRAAPTAYLGDIEKNQWVYDSGSWRLTHIDGSAGTKSTVANGKSVYTFTIHQYDFDLDKYTFPEGVVLFSDKTNEGQGLSTKGDFSFFGGYGQILYLMPLKTSSKVNLKQNIVIGNLEVTNASGQKLELPEGAQRGKTVEIENESCVADNKATSAVDSYQPGYFAKYSSFNEKDATSHPGKFLGTEFWGTEGRPRWDENTYAGSDIAIMGSAQLTPGSDNWIRAVNLVQLFDTQALSITPKDGGGKAYLTQGDVNFHETYGPTQEGHAPEVTYLFAADPAYPEGYDTNKEGVVSYMNLVRQSKLIYTDKLYWNEEAQRYNIIKYDLDRDGTEETFTCVGVLGEVRNCCYRDSVTFRFPVTVTNDPGYIGKTVCTVNGAVGWIQPGAMEGVTWGDGVWDSTEGKNTLEGYEAVTTGTIGNTAYNSPSGVGYTMWNNEASFRKVEYSGDGQYKNGTTSKAYGASLLILGYKAKVHITDQKAAENKAPYYSLDVGERAVTWILDDIGTEHSAVQGTTQEQLTDLTIPVKLSYDGKAQAENLQDLFYIPRDHYTTTIPVYNPDGTPQQDGEGKPVTVTQSIPTDSEHPAQITIPGTFKGESGETVTKLYTCGIYAVLGTDGVSVTFHLTDVPVGAALPDIRFQMNLGSLLQNADAIRATANISGSGDHRAYSEVNGNRSNAEVYISQLATTFLSKRVDKHYGELDTDITYTVTYTNSGDSAIAKSYFWDILPYPQDALGSGYGGSRQLYSVDYAVKLAGTDGIVSDSGVSVTVYGSTMDSAGLREEWKAFNSLSGRAERNRKIEELLDGDFRELKNPEDWAGVNGIVVKVEHLPGHRDLVLTLPMQTRGNQAGDLYLNEAWHWDAGSEALPLQSNIVQTRIVSREISGLVWHDRNLDGKRDPGEPLIGDVTASLFRKDADGNYVPWTQGVRGPIAGTVETGADGSYRFGELPEGEYIVAFSGETLKAYTGHTAYQWTDVSEAQNSDGVKKLQNVHLMDGDQEVTAQYGYFIRYTPESAGMQLHTLSEIAEGAAALNNGTEAYVHMDLGLVITIPELPETGGMGTAVFTLTGMLMLAAAALLLSYRRRKWQ